MTRASSSAIFSLLGFLIIVGIILFIIIRSRNRTVQVHTTSYATSDPQRPTIIMSQPAPVLMTSPAPVMIATPPPPPVFVQSQPAFVHAPSPMAPAYSPSYSSAPSPNYGQQPSAPPGY